MNGLAVCCNEHRAEACCDPLDCGPCCPRCPTCPALQALSPADRVEHARLVGTLTDHGVVESVRVHPAARIMPNLDDITGLALRLARLGQATAEAVEVLPRQSPWFSPRSGVLS